MLGKHPSRHLSDRADERSDLASRFGSHPAFQITAPKPLHTFLQTTPRTTHPNHQQTHLAKSPPDFAAALTIYSSGKNSIRTPPSTLRTMYASAHRNYGDEAYYKLAAAYFGKEFYLDEIMG